MLFVAQKNCLVYQWYNHLKELNQSIRSEHQVAGTDHFPILPELNECQINMSSNQSGVNDTQSSVTSALHCIQYSALFFCGLSTNYTRCPLSAENQLQNLVLLSFLQ